VASGLGNAPHGACGFCRGGAFPGLAGPFPPCMGSACGDDQPLRQPGAPRDQTSIWNHRCTPIHTDRTGATAPARLARVGPSTVARVDLSTVAVNGHAGLGPSVCIGVHRCASVVPFPCLALPCRLPHCAARRHPVWLDAGTCYDAAALVRLRCPDRQAMANRFRDNSVSTPRPAARSAVTMLQRPRPYAPQRPVMPAPSHMTPRRHPLARVSGERSRCGPHRASVTDAEGGMAKASGRSRWAARVAGNRRGPRHAEAGLTPDGEVAVSRGFEENWRSGQSAGRNVRVTR
jgi:hypothetical protein